MPRSELPMVLTCTVVILLASCRPAEEPSRAQLLKKACDGGDAKGCFDLGSMYRMGWGVPRDKAKAAQLFERACDGGETRGCLVLRDMYATGS